MVWTPQVGKPEMFDPSDTSLMENIAIAQDLCARIGKEKVRYICKTEHGWGSVVHVWHMRAGTYYISVTADTVNWQVRQVPRYRQSATIGEIRDGKAELYHDPIDSPYISGWYEKEERWVVKEGVN